MRLFFHFSDNFKFHHFIDGARFISHILRVFCAYIIRFLRICKFFTVFCHFLLHFTFIFIIYCISPQFHRIYANLCILLFILANFFSVFLPITYTFTKCNLFFFNPSFYLNSFLSTKFQRFYHFSFFFCSDFNYTSDIF